MLHDVFIIKCNAYHGRFWIKNDEFSSYNPLLFLYSGIPPCSSDVEADIFFFAF